MFNWRKRLVVSVQDSSQPSFLRFDGIQVWFWKILGSRWITVAIFAEVSPEMVQGKGM